MIRYLRTIDISHDHFGFYLAWGSTTLPPTIYTLQVQYLARYPVHLTSIQAALLLLFGLAGYSLFRSANHQKDKVRSTNDRCSIWGKPAQYIRCTFMTEDGATHESLLLCSGEIFSSHHFFRPKSLRESLTPCPGWWGISRHANYLGDLMQAFTMCAACGFTHLLPWSYFLFISAILFHRVLRDEQRCRRKYGVRWDEYCRSVRWRLIPGAF